MRRESKTNRSATWVASILFLLACVPLGPARAETPGEGGTLITLDADNISVIDVLQILASKTGLNIVTSPEVQGRKISIHLKNTPFEEALNLVVRAAALGYERVGKSILVAEQVQLSTQTGLVTHVFELNHASAPAVKEQLQVLSRDTSADAEGNYVIVRGTPSVIEQAAAVVAELDRKPGQVLLEARLIEVNTSDLLEVGIDWEKITKWTTVLTEEDPGPSRNGEIPSLLDFTKFDDTHEVYRQLAAFEVTLDALLTNGNARLLANAKLVTLDNQEAEIFAGETVPVVITSLQSPGGAGGVLQTIQLEKIDVGVKLGITPRITNDSFVTVLVEPEVSRIVAFVGPDDDLPQTSTRRARTYVRVRDGEKIYMGGLLSEETRSSIKRVPLLGHIPILGALFQHRQDEKVRLDLVIEITPRIVGDMGAALPNAPEPTLENTRD